MHRVRRWKRSAKATASGARSEIAGRIYPLVQTGIFLATRLGALETRALKRGVASIGGGEAAAIALERM